MDSQKQEELLKEALERAGAFEEMANTKGFELASAYYQNKVKQLMNELVNNEDKPIGEFERLRQEVIGLKKLFGTIQSDLEMLANYREEQKNGSKKDDS